MTPSVVPADEHLLARLRSAGAAITWRSAPFSRAGSDARIAHLHDEEARVEERAEGSEVTIVTDAGPVGALVLLLEIDRRGALPHLASVAPGVIPGFGQGGIRATWPGGGTPAFSLDELPVTDLIGLARYALV